MAVQNATIVRFHCCCTKEENHVDTITGSNTGVWKQYDLKLQTQFIWMPFLGAIKGVFSAISKLIPTWIVVSFILYVEKLCYGSKKKEPRNITFDDLAGVDATICELRYIISILHGKSESKKFRSKFPNGVLLYGPGRTGKTTLVHAMAREARVPFFPIYADDIVSGDVRLKNLFNEARRCSPSIVYIKHVEAIAQQGNGKSDPTLFQLHTEMEKCNEDGKMVMVIAATSSPETLDPALMSSGWFQKTFYVAKPDEDSRRKMVHFHLKDYIMKEDTKAICNLVASKTSGLVWAKIENVVADSRVAAIMRGGDHVTMDDVLHAIRRLDHYISLMNKFVFIRNQEEKRGKGTISVERQNEEQKKASYEEQKKARNKEQKKARNEEHPQWQHP
ncbi:ATPase, AAA-type, core, P-loop containing nucleoside triphosphate hydrolase [Artemisia annua]|uniref:ATPase, AAA-type, core, P-loop containing nucleoside triphosphate hydrolase n=1 Tax=Artemisia annua TaxID=35608 RepID=A0A2U1Q2F7_ARTAN|nr:ATPase, AAA-type, core, P-loop containing nucleoside triphosphate hydrolase [Artemisia annua]